MRPHRARDRVLRVFLPACTPDEIRQFFGPISTFYCEDDGGHELLAFTLDREVIQVKRSPVAMPGNGH